jgi:hypothetical protein
MQDVYCPVCGEPWENDTLHEYAQERGITYKEVFNTFFTEGCAEAFSEWGISSCEKSEESSLRASASSVLFDILGDDVDGIISTMSDMEYLGLVD